MGSLEFGEGMLLNRLKHYKFISAVKLGYIISKVDLVYSSNSDDLIVKF